MKLMLALGSLSRRHVNVLKIDSRTQRAVQEIGRSVDLQIKSLRVNFHAGVYLGLMIISVLVKAVLIRFRNQRSATKGVSCKNMDRLTAPTPNSIAGTHLFNAHVHQSIVSIIHPLHSDPLRSATRTACTA